MRAHHTFLMICMLACSGDAAALGVVHANSLQNPLFEDGLLYWNLDSPGVADWIVNLDFNDPESAGFGAGAIFGGLSEEGISQCAFVEAGQTYLFSAWVLPFCDGAARIQITWSSSACLSSTGAFQSSDSTSVGEWQKLALTATAPPGTEAALVQIRATSGCANVLFVDDAFFGDRIFSNSFE